MSRNSRQLGLGLIGIGKPWGHVPKPVPSEAEARELLEFAYELGIRYFDTAPSYGDGISEERLGRFLQSLTAEQRVGVTSATKFGEHWDRSKDEPYADHSWEALRRSLERSVDRLGPHRDSATAQDHARGIAQRGRRTGVGVCAKVRNRAAGAERERPGIGAAGGGGAGVRDGAVAVEPGEHDVRAGSGGGGAECGSRSIVLSRWEGWRARKRSGLFWSTNSKASC